ncbi:MAG TPA: cytochrome c oxidase assembly protein [Pyrinomonadaceae bacterium]
METLSDAVLSSWEWNPWILIPATTFGVLYTRGWWQLHQRAPDRFGFSQLIAFFGGLLTVIVALLSPLDAFAGWLLTVHMIQHLLLMMVAPPLVLWGAPYLPILSGLPRGFAIDGVGPFLSSAGLRRLARFVSHPVFCWSTFISVNVGWHIPVMYELALRSPEWHRVEHFSFLSTAILFWLPIIQPRPWVARTPRWLILPYLVLADFQNTALSAFLVFYDRVVYPTYAAVPRITNLTALEDQAAAGAVMWVVSSVFFLVPLGLITIELMTTTRKVVSANSRNSSLRNFGELFVSAAYRNLIRHLPQRCRGHRRYAEKTRQSRLDLLALPVVGRLLSWPHLRRSAQLLTFLLAVIVVIDGLVGPQMTAMNLAGVLPWTHWRGLTALTLLAIGNVFCFACPFNFARQLGRRILPARWSWPRRFRSKWITIALLLVFFWAYEAFNLWDSPRATAMLVIGYFAAAIIIDGLFAGATFCKYICPIGQYQFVQSLISPVEVRVRNLAICGSCTTHDCIRGNETQRGCELQLFVPRKTSNLDCTSCLDCVHACPHENVSLFASIPGTQLVQIARGTNQSRKSKDRSPKSKVQGRKSKVRSPKPVLGIGRNKFFGRFDVAVLVFLLVFAAFVNAGLMIVPVQAWEQFLQANLKSESIQPILAGLYIISILIVPALLVLSCVWLTKTVGRLQVGWRRMISTFAPAFVPLGFSMWLIHFSYHLLSGGQTALPVIQRAAMDTGFNILGAPDWSVSSVMSSFDWLPSLDLLLLDFGLLFSLYLIWRTASRFNFSFAKTLRLNFPWAGLAFVLYTIGVWIVFQPMQMRGMMMPSAH